MQQRFGMHAVMVAEQHPYLDKISVRIRVRMVGQLQPLSFTLLSKCILDQVPKYLQHFHYIAQRLYL